MATTKGHEAKNTILVFRVKRNSVCFCVAFARKLTLQSPTYILAQGPSCTIVAFILQPLQKDLAECLAGISHTHNQDQGHPFSVPTVLAYWTLLQSTTTRYLLPSGTRCPRQWVSGGEGVEDAVHAGEAESAPSIIFNNYALTMGRQLKRQGGICNVGHTNCSRLIPRGSGFQGKHH